jgi:methylenetetrahydrofolate reductase (NADPH)
MSELGGARIPPKIEQAFTSIAENEDSVQKLGIEIATTLCDELLQAGVPGLHFYTMNSAKATLEIAANLGLSENES